MGFYLFFSDLVARVSSPDTFRVKLMLFSPPSAAFSPPLRSASSAVHFSSVEFKFAARMLESPRQLCKRSYQAKQQAGLGGSCTVSLLDREKLRFNSSSHRQSSGLIRELLNQCDLPRSGSRASLIEIKSIFDFGFGLSLLKQLPE